MSTIKQLEEQIAELIKDNEELKSCLEYDPEEAEIVSKTYINGLIEEIQTYKETLDEHFHHYDKLKEENKKLKSQLHDLNIAFFTSSAEEAAKIKQLKEENKKLKEQLKSHEDLCVIYYKKIEELQEENKN